MAGQGAAVLAAGRVPQPHRLVVAAAGQQPPVRAERHPEDPAGVAGQGAALLAAGRVPQPHRLVVAAAGQQPPVRAERHPGDGVDRGRSGCGVARRWPGPTAAPSCRGRSWPAAARPG